MAQEIIREDLDDLQITKSRMQEITLSELQGTTFDTRNKLKARKWDSISRTSLSQNWVDVTR